MGYTTCILHTLAHGQELVDRNGWFQALQRHVHTTEYPDALVRAVIAKNFPVLGSIISSYEDQIESAFARRDLVSLIHRTAAWLDSYFDIVFAVNRQYHPGEKRLLAQAARLPRYPTNMVDDLTKACWTVCDLKNCVADHLKNTRESLAAWLQAQGQPMTDQTGM